MSAGKGDKLRRVNGDKFRRNHEVIFRKFYEQEPTKGEVIDAHEYLGNGGWQAVNGCDQELRDGDD